MFKKILLSVVIILTIFTLNTEVFADPHRIMSRRLDVTTFQLTKDLDGIKTTEKNQVISGRAEEGSKINLTIFWFMNDEDTSIISRKKISDINNYANGEWILQEKYSFDVKASELFAQPVSLNVGKNKINIRVVDTDGNIIDKAISIVVYKNEPTDYLQNIILKDLKK